ncbi:hypothetical protein EVA_05693 [gut metagenome]|uniref:Uncharacterized protein n=1 Tax=gut metagenome TaxID=749906 RepID=J9GTW4_9ZZZZ
MGPPSAAGTPGKLQPPATKMVSPQRPAKGAETPCLPLTDKGDKELISTSL